MSFTSATNSRDPGLVWVVGMSNSGKTTLIERLIPRLRARGLRVGTVKHAHHGFEMDVPGKDSWRHAQAGAEAVAVISPTRTAWLVHAPEELSCAQAVERIRDRVDLVLVVGFKQLSGPRLLLEPAADSRLTVEEAHCRIGVPVPDLTTDELERIAQFCADRRQQ